MDLIITIVAFIFIISVLVLIHELGHFLTAKRIGVTVEAFSIGFGPKLITWKKNGTEYRISALPFGGYVKMLGENPDEETTGDPGEYMSRKRWERFLILVMGPVMNILLAFLIWFGIIMVGEEKPVWLTQQPVVEFTNPGTPAANAGILPGDKVVEINGEKMETWEQLLYKVATLPREKINVIVERDDGLIHYSIQPVEDPRSGIGQIGIGAGYPPVISGIEANSAAEIVGLQNGDRVLEINGKPVHSWWEIYYEVTRTTQKDYALKSLSNVSPLLLAWESVIESNNSVDLLIDRNGQQVFLSVSPIYDPNTDFKRLGIAMPETENVIVQKSLPDAFISAGARCIDMSTRLFDVLGKLITGKLSTKTLSGPVEIAKVSGVAAKQGIVPFLNLMAFISLNLGIVNLLPLPVLDGGQILILTVEGIFRRDMSLKVKEWIMTAGVIMLVVLMVFIISQDIWKQFN